MEDLIESMSGGMKLSEGERIEITINETDIADLRGRSERCLLGRLMSDRRIQKEAFKTLMSRLWKTVETVTFKEIQDNLWLLEFSNREDKGRVLEGRPWLFDRSLLVLKEIDENTPPSLMEFSNALFWVQLHDMPLTCMNREVGMRIGRSLGVVEDIDVTGDGVGWGRSLRIRVSIDITKPLERGRAIVLNGKSIWISLKYEKLPQFCYHCGRIYHADKACPNKSSFRINEEGPARPWGVWLRADDLRFRKEGSSPFRQSDHYPEKQVWGGQEPRVLEGFIPAESKPHWNTDTTDDRGRFRSPGGSAAKQAGGESRSEGPEGSAPDGPVGKMDVQCTTDNMESDENMGGTSGINEMDSVEDLEGENVEVSRIEGGNQRGKPLTKAGIGVNNQNDMEVRESSKEHGCIEPSAEARLDRRGATLTNEKGTTDVQEAEKKFCNTKVAANSHVHQQEIMCTENGICLTVPVTPNPKYDHHVDQANLQESTEEPLRSTSKARKWKRKSRETTNEITGETDRKRKLDDVEWSHAENQKLGSKKSHSGGEFLFHMEEAVAGTQPRLSP
jgi:hypothetical protein